MVDEDRLKRVIAWLSALLFVIATALGVPLGDGTGQKKNSKSLTISDECEAEIKDIPIYGDISKQCKEELEKLDRRLHHVENLWKQKGE